MKPTFNGVLSGVVAEVDANLTSGLPSISSVEILASKADLLNCLFGEDDKIFNYLWPHRENINY